MHSFLLFFAIRPCRDGGSKSEKRCQDAFNNAHERAEHAIFRVQVGVCLSLELCSYLGGSIFSEKRMIKFGFELKKSREMKRRNIKNNKNQQI